LWAALDRRRIAGIGLDPNAGLVLSCTHRFCAGSRTKGLLMAYKLLDMAQERWRRLDGAHLQPLVRAGIVFVHGVQQEGKASKPRARAA
jgi:hypothetical protein